MQDTPMPYEKHVLMRQTARSLLGNQRGRLAARRISDLQVYSGRWIIPALVFATPRVSSCPFRYRPA